MQLRCVIAFRVVCVSLGLVLFAAAYLKFRDLTWEPFGKALFIPPRVRVIFIEMEAILGVWLLTGFASRTLWSMSVLYFTTLAGVSLYLASHGEPTCGCFGQAIINPWLTFGIDTAAILALGITRPRFGTPANATRVAGTGVGRTVALWAGFAFVVAVVFQVVRAGGIAPAWEALIAQGVTVEPTVMEIGSGENGENVIFSVTLRNHSHHAVRIIGGTNSCIGNATLNLPVEIPTGESRSVKVEGNFRGTPGRFVREYAFLTDQDLGGIVTARFAGTLLPKQ